MIDFTTLLYLPMVILWPYQDDRFLLPAAPLLLLFLFEGLTEIGGLIIRDQRRRQKFFGPAVSVILAILIGIFSWHDVAALIKDKRRPGDLAISRGPGFRITAANPGAYHSLILLEWLRVHTTPADRIVFHSYPPCALLTGRECSPFPWASPDRLLQFLDENRITFVVLDDEAQSGAGYLAALTPRFLLPALQAHPERFQSVTQAGSARVLRVMPQKLK